MVNPDVDSNIADGCVWSDELTKILEQELQTLNAQEMCAKLNVGFIWKPVKVSSHPLLTLKTSILKSVKVDMGVC